jgi:hypothetical protein
MERIVFISMVVLLVGTACSSDFKLPMGEYTVSFNLDIPPQVVDISLYPPTSGPGLLIPESNGSCEITLKSYGPLSPSMTPSGDLTIVYTKYPIPQSTTVTISSADDSLGKIDGHSALITHKEKQDGSGWHDGVFWPDSYTQITIISSFNRAISDKLLNSFHVERMSL